jgi:K+/H+ antiporter YhaU regulatory subunit KhtT
LGKEAVALAPELKVVKVSALGLTGHHPSELGIREKTGCSVIAVERDEQLLVEFGPDFCFSTDDAIYICGSSDATQKYSEFFPQG